MSPPVTHPGPGAHGQRFPTRSTAAAPSWPSLRPAARWAVGQAAVSGALALVFMQLAGAQPGLVSAGVCALPLLLTLVLARTDDKDRRQYVARLFASMVFTPFLLAFWAGSEPGTAPTAVLAAGAVTGLLLQGLAWVGALLAMARAATRLEPAAGTAALPHTPSARLLGSRLLALPAAGWPLTVHPGPQPGTWVALLDVSEDGTRLHRVRLDFDPVRREVQVLEDLSARDARPQTPDESDMSTGNEHSWDPTRPDAQRVTFWIRQVTMLERETLAAVPTAGPGARVDVLIPSAAEAADLPPYSQAAERGEALLAVLAAVVTRSGLAWQPALLLRSGRWRAASH